MRMNIKKHPRVSMRNGSGLPIIGRGLKEAGLKDEEIKRVIDPMESFHLQLKEEVDSYERSQVPTADDENTPEQRKVIDAQIAEARKGPYFGPFETADEAIGFLNKEIGARSGNRKKPNSKH